MPDQDAPTPPQPHAAVSPLWQRLVDWDEQRRDSAALYLPSSRSAGRRKPNQGNSFHALTYTQLLRGSEDVARGLHRWGLTPGMTVAVLVPVSEQFFTLMFGLLRLGAVPVLIDPGIGTAALKTCLDEADPAVFIGNSKALVARRLLAWCPKARVILTDPVPAVALRAMRSPVTTLASLLTAGVGHPLPEGAPLPDQPALVAYTSGSTGAAKGVMISASSLVAQIEHLQRLYDLQAGVVNVATFAPFALLGPLLGLTTVVPRMDFSRPARANPQLITEAITAYQAEVMFASPALLNTLQRWARPHGVRLPSLTRIISAGAPVSRRLQHHLLTLLPDGAQIHTPYGSTEALPVTTIGSTELLALRHSGICVGRPVEGSAVAIVPISDEPIAALPDQPEVPVGQVGEIVVQGPQVSNGYFHRPSADLANKTQWQGQLAHRMGDLGYRDGQGRIWLCGRRAERVITTHGTLYTTVCEEVTNADPAVERSALVGLGKRGKQRPVMIVQPVNSRQSEPSQLIERCVKLLAANADTAEITTVLVKASFPVDVRHNAKIRRFELADWAARELARIENRPPARVADPLPAKRSSR